MFVAPPDKLHASALGQHPQEHVVHGLDDGQLVATQGRVVMQPCPAEALSKVVCDDAACNG